MTSILNIWLREKLIDLNLNKSLKISCNISNEGLHQTIMGLYKNIDY